MLFNLLPPSPQRLALLDNGLTTKITIFVRGKKQHSVYSRKLRPWE